VVNTSVNQTLSRTLLTTGYTLLAVIALLLLGGDVLHDFAFALLVGMIAGTYSTIFIANPLLVYGFTWRAARATRSVVETVDLP
jgi:preprotein translocase subunit SecF